MEQLGGVAGDTAVRSMFMSRIPSALLGIPRKENCFGFKVYDSECTVGCCSNRGDVFGISRQRFGAVPTGAVSASCGMFQAQSFPR